MAAVGCHVGNTMILVGNGKTKERVCVSVVWQLNKPEQELSNCY